MVIESGTKKDLPLSNDSLNKGKSLLNTTKHKHRVYAEIVSPGRGEVTTPLRVLVHETLSSSAVDTIRDSQQLANELAKVVVLEVLGRKENQNKLGLFLQYIFASDTVLSPSRELIFWSLAFPETFSNLIYCAKWHRNYWIGRSSLNCWHFDDNQITNNNHAWDLGQHGDREHIQAAVVKLTAQWLDDPTSRTEVATPLLDWTLQQQEFVISPLAVVIAEAIPWAKVFKQNYFISKIGLQKNHYNLNNMNPSMFNIDTTGF